MENQLVITKISRVVMVDKYEYLEKFTAFSAKLPYNELIFHFEGVSRVYFNDNVFDIQPNTLRFLPKGEHSRYCVEREKPGLCILIAFDSNKPLSNEAFVIHNDYTYKLAPLFKKLFSLWVGKNEGYYFECLSMLYKILGELQKKNYLSDDQLKLIKPAIEYVEKYFLNKKIRAEELAECCQISYPYIKKLFVKKFGVPPIRYSIQLKINHACDLLKSGRYSITQIAKICGYNDTYFFSRQFKEYVGITPSAFCEKYKSSK